MPTNQTKHHPVQIKATARLKATAGSQEEMDKFHNDGTEDSEPQDFASQVFDAEGMNADKGGFIKNK